MTLVRWNPMRGWLSPEKEMEQFLGNFWGKETQPLMNWSPRMDLTEDEDRFELNVEVPGLRKEDINIKFQDKVLTLSGERLQQEKKEGTRYHRVERRYGKFERSFYLPEDVKGDEIKARYQDGILTVTVPKSEKVKPREIAIS